MSTETAAEIAADLVTLRASRTKLASGEMIGEVTRGGRKLVLGKVTIDGLTKLIALREQEYEAAVNAEAGKPRRSAISFEYR